MIISVASPSMRINNLTRKQKVISIITLALIFFLILCFLWNAYYRRNYASKRFVLRLIEDAAANNELQVDAGTLSASISKKLNDTLDNMDLSNLSDEQVEKLMELITGYLDTSLDSLTQEQIQTLATDIIAHEISDRLSDNESLMTELQAKTMKDLEKKIAEYTKLVNSYSAGSTTSIADLASALNMTEDELKSLINDKTQTVDDKYATITNKSDIDIKSVAQKLNITESELRKIISGENEKLSSALSSLKTYTTTNINNIDSNIVEIKGDIVTNTNQLNDKISDVNNDLITNTNQLSENISEVDSKRIRYGYTKDENGKITVTLTLPTN